MLINELYRWCHVDFGNFRQSRAVSSLNAKLIIASAPSSYTSEPSDGSFNMNAGLL